MLGEIAAVAGGIVQSAAQSEGANKLVTKATEFIDTKFRDPKLISGIEDQLRIKFGEETFYNDFDAYIKEYHTIEHVIDMFYNIGKTTILSCRTFVEQNLNTFSGQYPQYGAYDIAMLKEGFEIIYVCVHSALVCLNPHTDAGKLQISGAIQAEQNHHEHNEMNAKLDLLLSQTASIMVNKKDLAEATRNDIGGASETVKLFLRQIDQISELDIGDEESISKYLELSNSALIKLRGEPQSQVDKVICALQCRMAIRYCNLGRVEKAFECLSNVDSKAADESKIYHFVNAVIIVNHSIESKYEEARVSLNKALKLDENYHRAVLALQFLNALQKESSLEVILREFDAHFEPILIQNDDKDLIADYYIHRAFIYKEFDDFVNAEAMFIKAKECGYDDLVLDYNIALVYYSKATQHLPKDKRFFGVEVDAGALSKTIGICKSWLIDSRKPISDFLKTRMVSLYSSACGILGTKHGLASIDEYLLLPDLEYETKRMLIFELEGAIPDQYTEHLDADDKLYAETVNFYKRDDYEGLKKKFSEMDEGVLASLPAPTLYMVLQMCVIKHDTETYYSFRKYINKGDEVPLIYCLDAYALEIEGKTDQAKAIIDQHKETSTDYHLLSNILGFYVRNNYLDDAKQLFLIILSKSKKQEIFIDEKEDFFGRAITFFTKNKSLVVKEFIEASENDLSENENIWRVKAQFYESISDLPNLLECLNWLYQQTKNFDFGYNRVVCNFQLMNYSSALEEAHSLLSTISEGNIAERVRVIWLISNINLFLENEDESYEWAKKAHELTKETPSDGSHAAYLARATRTGHIDEALPESIEYKRIHPVIIDEWMKELRLPSEGSGESLIDIMDETLGRSHTDYLQQEKEFATNYKRNHLPNSIILKRHGSLAHFFIFAAQNKLIVSNGDATVMDSKVKTIGDDIFVDALTLIVLQQYGCFDLLKKISRIHICYATVNKLQEYYPTLDFVYVKDILSWLAKADNIVWEQNNFAIETDLANVFSNEYLICCHVASRANIPLLTIEPNIEVLCADKADGAFVGLQTVGLVSLCYRFMDTFPNEAHQGIYRLLEHCSFVNFNANSIIAQIERDGNTIIVDSLSRFFFCNTSCDMISFANVYLQTTKHLITQNEDVAIDFVEILLNNAEKIWRRSSHYMHCVERFDDKESEAKVQATVQYLVLLLVRLKGIFNEIPERIQPLYERISLHVSKKFGKDFIDNIKGALLSDE